MVSARVIICFAPLVASVHASLLYCWRSKKREAAGFQTLSLTLKTFLSTIYEHFFSFQNWPRMCETENPTFAAGWDFLVAFFGMAIFLGRPLDNKIDLNV